MHHQLFPLSSALLSALLLFPVAPLPCGAAPQEIPGTFVVPAAYTSTPGDSNNVIPLSWGLFGLPQTGRVQQAYPASEFTGIGTAIQITGIAFRPDEQDSTSSGTSSSSSTNTAPFARRSSTTDLLCTISWRT